MEYREVLTVHEFSVLSYGSNVVRYRHLLVSLALTAVTWGSSRKGDAAFFGRDVGAVVSCAMYSGIYQLVTGKTEHGVQLFQDALSLMDGISVPEQRILRTIVFQIFAMYYRFKENSSRIMSIFYGKALEECRAAGDAKLHIIRAM